MAPQQVPAIAPIETSTGFTYRIRFRRIGIALLLGWVVIAVGIALVSIASWFFVKVVSGVATPTAVGCASVVAIPLAGLGLWTAFIGGWMAFGYDEIKVTSKHLCAVLHVGFLRWTVKRRRERVSRITLLRQGTTGAGLLWLRLQAEGEGIKPLLLAFAHPRDVMISLAEDLIRRWPESLGKLHLVEVSEFEPDENESAEQPPNSRIIVESRSDGIIVTEPPRGLWRGTHPIAVIWTLGVCFLAVVGLLFLTHALVSGQRTEEGFTIPISPVQYIATAGFGVVACFAFAIVLHQTIRKTVLTVSGDRLIQLRTGLFGQRRREWARDTMRTVEAVLDTDSENNPFVYLKLVLQDGSRVDLVPCISGDSHSKAEREWMARILREALRLK